MLFRSVRARAAADGGRVRVRLGGHPVGELPLFAGASQRAFDIAGALDIEPADADAAVEAVAVALDIEPADADAAVEAVAAVCEKTSGR